MLEKAQNKIHQERWNNIKLKEVDVTEFENKRETYFDVGICTLGISIIPDWKRAYYNLFSHVRIGGEIIIGDMKLAIGWRYIFNPLRIHGAKGFGGSYKGHKNSTQLFSLMERELSDVSRSFWLYRLFRGGILSSSFSGGTFAGFLQGLAKKGMSDVVSDACDSLLCRCYA